TSHDVVAIARRQLNMKKIGHCGTLDPMATGLLMLVINRATKIQDLLMSEDKTYAGTLTLGATTSTQDKEGEIEVEKDVPDLNAEQVSAAFDKYTGDFEQIPPIGKTRKQQNSEFGGFYPRHKTVQAAFPRPRKQAFFYWSKNKKSVGKRMLILILPNLASDSNSTLRLLTQ
ncbi:hypothetical protein N8531_01100, partial [bacterium]|nr:hypothetical protein [bacterium]